MTFSEWAWWWVKEKNSKSVDFSFCRGTNRETCTHMICYCNIFSIFLKHCAVPWEHRTGFRRNFCWLMIEACVLMHPPFPDPLNVGRTSSLIGKKLHACILVFQRYFCITRYFRVWSKRPEGFCIGKYDASMNFYFRSEFNIFHYSEI